MSNGDLLVLSGITGFGTAGWTAIAQSDGSGGTEVFLASVPCYCRGTLILTERGEVPVEYLAIGDEVVTVSGTMRPITWMGRRKVAARFCDPLRAWPVRIKADALADCVPVHDLLCRPITQSWLTTY